MDVEGPIEIARQNHKGEEKKIDSARAKQIRP